MKTRYLTLLMPYFIVCEAAHLISNDHDAVLVRQLPQRLHEAWWGCQEASLTQHWLKDDGSNI